MAWIAVIFLFSLTLGAFPSVAQSQIPEDLQKQLVRHGRALLIGVSNYKDPGWQVLPNAKLEDLETGLKPHFETVVVLTDPTVGVLRRTLEQFLRDNGSDERSRLFIYYSGHGFTDLNRSTHQETGFITGKDTPAYTESDPDPAIFNSISMREYDNMTRISHARQILTVFDSCFSGTIFSARAAPNTATKWDFERVRQALNRPVRYYITAGRANETVPANSKFARALLRGISGEASAADGFITGASLGLYLQRTFPNLIGHLITPQYGAVDDVDLSAGQFVFLDLGRLVPLPPVGPSSNGPSSNPHLKPRPAEHEGWHASQCGVYRTVGNDGRFPVSLNFAKYLALQTATMEMTITLPKNEYALLKSRKARCEYTNGPEGTFKLGSKTLRSTSAGSTGTLFSIPVDGGKGWQGDGCDWEDEIRLLSISGDSEIRAYVGLLIKNKTADFTLTRGPKSGHTISIALDGIQEALQAAKCSDVNIAAYLSNR